MPETTSNLAAFVAELRRRRVFRVAAVYAGVAFVIIQIIDGAFGYLRIPEWVGTTVIVLVLLGFPVAIGLAWAFDITEKGIVRTRGRSKGKPGTSNRALIAVAVLAVIVAVWGWKDRLLPGGPAPITSIAVLPLDDYVGNPDQAYFVDGMTEAITSRLSQIAALKVIARTSVMQYANSPRPPAQTIAEPLASSAGV